MTNRYKITVEEEDGCTCITEQDSDYQLILKEEGIGGGPVCFRIPNPANSLMPDCTSKQIPVTGRDLSNYPQEAKNLRINPRVQYAEIGPGFGAFLPNLAMLLGRSSPKPIAIDIFNYELGEQMLQFAKREEDLHLTQKHYQEIDKFLKRKRILTNPDKIQLINTSLGEAIRQHPEILGTVDVLIDSCGASMYADIEILEQGVIKVKPSGNFKQQLEDRVDELEKSLLKPEGKIIRFR